MTDRRLASPTNREFFARRRPSLWAQWACLIANRSEGFLAGLMVCGLAGVVGAGFWIMGG